MKTTRSFLLRGALQSADYSPVGDRRILARSPIVGGPVESYGSRGNDDVPYLGFANQASTRSDANKNASSAAGCFRQYDPHRRPAHSGCGDRDIAIAVLPGVRNQASRVIRKSLRAF